MRALDRRAVRRNTVHFGTTLYPVIAGALVALAEREVDGNVSSAIATIARREVDRLARGAWSEAKAAADALDSATPDERAAAAAEVIRAALRGGA